MKPERLFQVSLVNLTEASSFVYYRWLPTTKVKETGRYRAICHKRRDLSWEKDYKSLATVRWEVTSYKKGGWSLKATA